jgi:hypothetical protein
MEKQREIFEKRSEILTKKLMSKIYALEASYLESRMKAQKNVDQVSEQLNEWEEQLKKLEEEKEKLSNLYENMVSSTKTKWEEASRAFEEYAEKVNSEKQNFYERTQGWVDDFGVWISDLDERARHSSGQFRDQINSQVDYLKKQQNNLLHWMGDLQKATGDNWEKISGNISQEVKTMRSTINKTYQTLTSTGRSGSQKPETDKTQEAKDEAKKEDEKKTEKGATQTDAEQ